MSPLSISIIWVILGAVWWFLHRHWTTTSSSNRHQGVGLPPGPRGLPIIGHLHRLGSLPHRALNDLAKKHGPIMFLRLGYVPAIVVSTSTAAELIYKTHDTVFASRPKAQSTECITYGEKGITFTPYGSYWRDVRKICAQELLSTSKIDSLALMRHEELVLFVKSLREAADMHVMMDITDKVGVLVENMTFRMLFGRSRDERFDLRGIFDEIVGILGAFNIGDYVPFLGALDLQGLNRRAKKVSKVIDKMLEIIINEHELDSEEKHKRPDMDLVDMLLSSKHKSTSAKPQNSPTFDRASVKAIVLDLIFGAIETSRTAIEWVMSEIIKHPSVMARLQEELTTVVGDKNIVEEAHLSKLHYLYMIVKESLRLHPVGPLSIPRESTEDIVIDGYYIPKKSRIILNSWAIGRDPDVWSSNANEFIPERFIGRKIDLQGRNFELTPFGSGRRKCPGTYLGLINIQLVVAQLVHCFNWELPNGKLPTELDMDEKFGLTMVRVNHLVAKPVVRGREKFPA